MEKTFKVTISRDYVEEYDKIRTLEKEVNYTFDSKIIDIIKELVKSNFLDVSNKEGVWVLETSSEQEILSYHMNTELFASVSYHIHLYEIVDNTKKLHFRFYENSLERAKHIFLSTNGSKARMINEGLDSEYNCCMISNLLESEWRVKYNTI